VSAEACAALVARGDPWRWRAAMAAPPPARGRLMALYAFNLEIARAGWVTSEPLIGEIRLRWWADAIAEIAAGQPPRAHEVCAPLAEAIRGAGLPVAPFEAMIAARAWDCGREGFEDQGALEAYLEATSGGLMLLAARALGAGEAADGPARDLGTAAGAAAWLRALGRLCAAGRDPMPGVDAAGRAVAARGETTPALAASIAALARAGLARRDRAWAARGAIPRAARPALLPAAGTRRALRRALAAPEAVLGGGLEVSEARGRAAMLALAVSGRW
jgi:phytoene/squalene synthetase